MVFLTVLRMDCWRFEDGVGLFFGVSFYGRVGYREDTRCVFVEWMDGCIRS